VHVTYAKTIGAVCVYLAADVMLVTPLRDGMNLVAKEYVAARIDEQGALVLSEFTGAAAELDKAFLINPYDSEDIKRAILEALAAGPDELCSRMRPMRTQIETHDLNQWAKDFLEALSTP
jgi:trehalose 6-phosphate synthase